MGSRRSKIYRPTRVITQRRYDDNTNLTTREEGGAPLPPTLVPQGIVGGMVTQTDRISPPRVPGPGLFGTVVENPPTARNIPYSLEELARIRERRRQERIEQESRGREKRDESIMACTVKTDELETI